MTAGMQMQADLGVRCGPRARRVEGLGALTGHHVMSRPARKSCCHCVPAGPAGGLQRQGQELEPSLGQRQGRTAATAGNSALAPQRVGHRCPKTQQLHPGYIWES